MKKNKEYELKEPQDKPNFSLLDRVIQVDQECNLPVTRLLYLTKLRNSNDSQKSKDESESLIAAYLKEIRDLQLNLDNFKYISIFLNTYYVITLVEVT